MFGKCLYCDNYVEEEEEICVDCHILFAEENEYDHDSEMIVEEYGDNDFLNEKGALLIRE